MTAFDAHVHLAKLKQFQRHTVDHVVKRFYDDDPPARRFLVADETGLGKSMVGRGVIARTIERLEDDDACQRIDVIYVCSNADIAEQNLERLDVLESGTTHATRLTLLSKQKNDLNGTPQPGVGKRVNLVSFTPGTSFDMGYATGRAEERALLHIILCDDLGYTGRTALKAAAVVLRGDSGLQSFERSIGYVERELDAEPPDPAITKPFLKEIRSSGLRRRFHKEVEGLGRRTRLRDEERTQHRRIVGELRAALARAGVAALEPDLIILDEFQRFRHLLALDDPNHREAAELAHTLFNHGDAKVLLLSATPYKPFTYAEESVLGDDHMVDLRRTLTFLAEGNGDPAAVDRIVEDLAEYRRLAIDGAPTATLRSALERSLTLLMTRTERPRLGDDGMLMEQCTPAAPVPAGDLAAYVALRRLATAVKGPMAVDYWKSTPYFINFGDGYRLGELVREKLKDREERARVRPLVEASQHLDARAIEELQPIDPGNARLRTFRGATVGRGWWRLLWVPPSAPYEPLGGPFADPQVEGMTKQLIFSSWTATPSAIAALLSLDATRQISGTRAALEGASQRLDWRADGGRPGAMTTLMVFLPNVTLASRGAPGTAEGSVPAAGNHGAEAWYWTSMFDRESLPWGLSTEQAAAALTGEMVEEGESETVHGRLDAHLDLAFALRAGRHDVAIERRTSEPDDLSATIDAVARYGPGNIALRCLRRIVGPSDEVTDVGLWTAAATLAGGFRSVFNRPESMLLLDQLLPDLVYWRAVLQYCAWGGLEAVLDEYLFHTAEVARSRGLDDEKLLRLAQAARRALTPVPSPYRIFDPTRPDKPIAISGRFALRYGGKRATNEENLRLPEVRGAFNSPFWPFVLATTSIGQEGIDLHWWCHSAVHWNTPASPVDFEQREGRVNRYAGHAIRRNLAAEHRDDMLAAVRSGGNPWDAAFEAAAAAATDRHDGLAPHWITPGNAHVERHLYQYPLSHDHDRYQRLKDELAVYRLTFGQPRQEDLAALLLQRGVHLDEGAIRELHLDLRPTAARAESGVRSP